MAKNRNIHPSITLHLPQELMDLIKERASKEDTNKSNVIRDAIWFYMANKPE